MSSKCRIHISGGTITRTPALTSAFVRVGPTGGGFNAVLCYVSGTPEITNGITKRNNATGYYTGDNEGLFGSTFTAGTDLHDREPDDWPW